MPDEDWTLPEAVRNIKDIKQELTHKVGESTYSMAQRVVGERIEAEAKRITTIETKREAEALSRDSQYRKIVAMFIAAGLGLASSIVVMILQIVADSPK